MIYTKTYKLTIKIFGKYLTNNHLVAISGGQDSIYLLNLIENFYIKYKEKTPNTNNISYIYIDHQWRTDSYQQVIHLINYITLTNKKIYIYQLPYNILSENLSRLYRYHIFNQHAIKYKNQFIITGHNKTDKLETFLKNFFKGSGTQGITSLVVKSQINKNRYLLRPLLNLKRNDIYWNCKRFNLPIWSDKTNYTYNFERNRTRCELIPYLKKYFHNNIEDNINELLETCYQDNEYIRQNTIKLYLKSRHQKFIAMNYQKLKKQNFSLQLKVIQLFCTHNINLTPTYNQINTILLKINKNQIYNNFQVKLGYLLLNINNSWIYITVNMKSYIKNYT